MARRLRSFLPPSPLGLECLDDRTLPAVGLGGLLGPTGTLANLLDPAALVGGLVPAASGLVGPVLGPVVGTVPATIPSTPVAGTVLDTAAVSELIPATTAVVEQILTPVVESVPAPADLLPTDEITPTPVPTPDTDDVVSTVAPTAENGDRVVTAGKDSVPQLAPATPGLGAPLSVPAAEGAGTVLTTAPQVEISPVLVDVPGVSSAALPNGVVGRTAPDAPLGGIAAAPAADLPARTPTNPEPARELLARLPDAGDAGGVRSLPLPVPTAADPTADRLVLPPIAVSLPGPAVPRDEAGPVGAVPVSALTAPADPPPAAASGEGPAAEIAVAAPADAEAPGLLSRFLPFDTSSLRAGVDRVLAAINPGLPHFEEWDATDWGAVAAALAVGAGVAYAARGGRGRRLTRSARVRLGIP